MFRLACAAAIAMLTLGAGVAAADPVAPDQTVVEEKGVYHPWDWEAGFYGGGFISNHLQQFYDDSVYSGTTSGPNQRPNIDTLDAEIGARAALFFTENLGVEVEGSNIFARVHHRSQEFASIYGAAIQGMYQLPMGAFTPYVAVGFSMRHVSSPANVLGSDTDWPAHVGIGARYWLAPTVAVRADFRYMRGPEEGHGTDPSYTWGAGYGEFMVGFSFRPRD